MAQTRSNHRLSRPSTTTTQSPGHPLSVVARTRHDRVVRVRVAPRATESRRRWCSQAPVPVPASARDASSAGISASSIRVPPSSIHEHERANENARDRTPIRLMHECDEHRRKQRALAPTTYVVRRRSPVGWLPLRIESCLPNSIRCNTKATTH